MSFKKSLLSTSRRGKQVIVASSDFVSLSLATIFAALSSSLSLSDVTLEGFLRILWTPVFSIFIFYLYGVYRSVLRYIDFVVIYSLCKAILTAFLINLLLRFFYLYFSYEYFGTTSESWITPLGWTVGLLSSIVLVVGSRIYAHYIFSTKKAEKKVVIYGAGSAGIQLAEALKVSSEMQPIAFVDSNSALQGTYLGGLKIIHPRKLEKMVSRNKLDEVLIAMPSASKSVLRNLLNEIESYSIKVRILPGLAELAQGKVSVSELKEVEISDLLGRFEVEADKELLNKNIKDKVVMITGAGGSIGSEITRQVSKNKPKSVVMLDTSEYSLYTIRKEIELIFPEITFYSILANVTNKSKIYEICNVLKVDTIYHTAAYKHVPLVEENPFEGVSNNIFGTKSCVEAAIDSGVETFVLISTDKAVRPTNIMGATKRVSEMILQSLSLDERAKNKARMTMVRFGNVLGSSGSAIPLFQQQIKDGGPVTVTDPEITRYFMSIPEAAELVIQAGAMGTGGDVFVLDMGDPVKILELAKRLINLSGLELRDENNTDGDIEIIFTGLRPGEKLFEELLIGDNVKKTEHKQILRAEEDSLTSQEIDRYIHLLEKAAINRDVSELKTILEESVIGYVPERTIVDALSSTKK